MLDQLTLEDQEFERMNQVARLNHNIENRKKQRFHEEIDKMLEDPKVAHALLSEYAHSISTGRSLSVKKLFSMLLVRSEELREA